MLVSRGLGRGGAGSMVAGGLGLRTLIGGLRYFVYKPRLVIADRRARVRSIDPDKPC